MGIKLVVKSSQVPMPILLPKDSKIKYSSNTKETVKSGKLYTDVNEKGRL